MLFEWCQFDIEVNDAPADNGKDKGKGKKKKKTCTVRELLWCAGLVLEVSDATTVVKGKTIGAGHVQIWYDPPADEPDAEAEEDWFQVRSAFYRKQDAPGGWRLAQAALTNGVGADDIGDLSSVEESEEEGGDDDDDARADSDSESEPDEQNGAGE